MNVPSNLPATGRLGVLLPGMGAVASTFIAGVFAARKGLTPPIGSLSQMARLEVGSGPEAREHLIREVLPLAGLDDLVFGGGIRSRATCSRRPVPPGCSTRSTSRRSRPISRPSSPWRRCSTGGGYLGSLARVGDGAVAGRRGSRAARGCRSSRPVMASYDSGPRASSVKSPSRWRSRAFSRPRTPAPSA